MLNGAASVEELECFVAELSTRYAVPTAKLIRQRLGVARLCQDGYLRLCKALCPQVDPSCVDPEQNKVLRLISILARSYNLTIEASNSAGSKGEDAENAYFESKLELWEALGPFISVLPSRQGSHAGDVAAKLTRHFSKAALELENHIPLNADQRQDVVQRLMIDRTVESEEHNRVQALRERMQRSSPWRALQGETQFDVVRAVANDRMFGARGQFMAVERLRELARTPDQAMQARLSELRFLLDGPSSNRPKDAALRVEFLLAQALADDAVACWKAPVLQLQAKHLLAQNKWDEAQAKLREALVACSDFSYGTLRGEIARDAWAIALAGNRLSVANHEKYYRNMLDFGCIQDTEVTIEDTALRVAGFFWSDLYKPYHGVEARPAPMVTQAGSAIKTLLRHALEADWDAIQTWLISNRRTLGKAHLKDVRGDTVLTQWIKLLDRVQMMGQAVAVGSGLDIPQNWLRTAELLIGAWPEQVNMADFKGQTPLMLACDSCSVELVNRILATPGVDVDAQDYLGRTALHAAVAAGNGACVSKLLSLPFDQSKATYEELQTALHTAARLGLADIATQIKTAAPSLMAFRNSHGRTPKEECEWTQQEYGVYRQMILRQGRTPASLGALQATLDALSV